MKKGIIADLALLIVAMSWGLNFVITKDTLTSINPYTYLGIRFLIASAIMVTIFYKQLKNINRDDIIGGIVVGFFLFLGFLTQTLGLVYTTPSKSGFITGSNVVMVPFLAYFLTKKFPEGYQVLGAVVTFIGLGIISIDESLSINFGDFLTLLCAIAFSVQIVLTEHYVKRGNALNIAIVQITITAFLNMIMAIFFEPMPTNMTLPVWGAILFGAVVCTAGAYTVQNIAQKYTSSTHTAIILCNEAVFAGIFSYFLWKEPITIKTMLGFALVFAGILVTEVLPILIKSQKIETTIGNERY